MKKIICLLILVFLLSGCTVKYNLEIKEDLSVVETLTELMPKSNYDNEDDALYGFNNVISTYDPKRLYNTNFLEENESYGLNSKRIHSSLIDYYNNTLMVKELYDGVKVTSENGIISLKTIGNLKINNILYLGEPDNDGEYPASTIFPIDSYFSVKIPYVVLNHNADKVDSQNNIYYWTLDEYTTEDKFVEIEFDTNKKFKSLKTIVSSIDYTFILIIAIILIGMTIYNNIKKKNKINNEI